MNHHRDGQIYLASVAGSTLNGTAYDLFGLTPPTASRVAIHGVRLGLQSTNMVEQMLGVQFLRGSTAVSTSAAVTSRNANGWTGVSTAQSAVTGPSSALVSTASAQLIFSDSWNIVQRSYVFCPNFEERPILIPGQNLHVRITALSSDGPSFYGTLIFSEIGKNPI